ncbi:hypothetical protein LZ32DRAFT_117732 [Colletotrichum eremochloae]|nr:hypothetical protein LZ32DRAFT_117732 [Colletotrichum eremochloae]
MIETTPTSCDSSSYVQFSGFIKPSFRPEPLHCEQLDESDISSFSAVGKPGAYDRWEITANKVVLNVQLPLSSAGWGEVFMVLPDDSTTMCRACPTGTGHMITCNALIGWSRAVEHHSNLSVQFSPFQSICDDMSGDLNVQRQCQTCLATFSTPDKLQAHLEAYRVRLSPFQPHFL